MDEIPQIFSTDLVSPETDVFWNEPDNATESDHTDVLILTQSFEKSSAEHTQLNKILEACSLSEEKHHIVQVAESQNIAFNKINRNSGSKVIIVFGISTDQLGISALFRLNYPNNFGDNIIIPTLALSELEQQPQAKKELWVNALKPLFIDK